MTAAAYFTKITKITKPYCFNVLVLRNFDFS